MIRVCKKHTKGPMAGLAPGFVLDSEGTTTRPDAKFGRIFNEIFEESDCVHSVKVVYSVLGGVSIVCLSILILLHILLPQLRNLNGKILISCSSSTLLATLFLVIVYNYNPDQASNNLGCTVLGFFGLFSNLSMFSWMSVTCFNMVWTFRMMEVSSFQSSSSRKFIFYSGFGWGFPLLFTSTTSPQEKGEERKEGLEKEQGLAAINAVECFSADSRMQLLTTQNLAMASSSSSRPGASRETTR